MTNNYHSVYRHTESVVDSLSPFPSKTKFGYDLTQLRLFIEHCCIQYALAGKRMAVGSASDPCWCAWQHYISGLNEHFNKHNIGKHTPGNPAMPEEAIDDLASGWEVPFFPTFSLFKRFSCLNPIELFEFSRKIIMVAFKEGKRPSHGSPLSASAVASHFQLPRGMILKLKIYGPSDKRISILDDEQTKTLVYGPRWNNNESFQHNFGLIAPVLLIRWLRDSVLGIELRDIEAHGEIHKAVDLLPKVIEMACPGKPEHAYAIMRAVANNLWPENAIEWLLVLPQMNLEVIEAAYGSIKKDGLETRQPLSKVTAHLL